MRIYYDDPTLRYIHIDREALAAFLREQGVSDQRLKQLVIRIRPRIPKSYASETCKEETTLGVSLKNTVVVCTWQHPRNTHKLSNTLLHELYHFMTKGQYGPENYAIEYAKRPSEIAARKFAEQHRERMFLVLDLPHVQPQPVLAKTEQPAPAVAQASGLPVAVPAAALRPSPMRKRSVVAGAALAMIGLGAVLLRPLWDRGVKYA